MVANGFYKIVYDGKTGSGIGMIALLNGVASGIDEAGVQYDGVYEEDYETGVVEMHLRVTVPGNVPLVNGVPAKSDTWSFSFDAALPPGFGAGTPVSLRTPFGAVTAGFKLLRGL
jgi:hypothetical protein